MNNKAKVLSIVLIAIAIAVTGVYSFRKSISKSESVVIREIDTTAPSQWELAKKLTGRDILAEEGVKLEPVHSIPSSGGTVVLQALLAGNIDVSSSSAWPPFINIIARGGKIKALLGTAVSTRENQTNVGVCWFLMKALFIQSRIFQEKELLLMYWAQKPIMLLGST